MLFTPRTRNPKSVIVKIKTMIMMILVLTQFLLCPSPLLGLQQHTTASAVQLYTVTSKTSQG